MSLEAWGYPGITAIAEDVCRPIEKKSSGGHAKKKNYPKKPGAPKYSMFRYGLWLGDEKVFSGSPEECADFADVSYQTITRNFRDRKLIKEKYRITRVSIPRPKKGTI